MTFKYLFSKCCCMCKKSKILMINNDELMKNIYIENYIDNACVKDSTSIETKNAFLSRESTIETANHPSAMLQTNPTRIMFPRVEALELKTK